MMKPFKILSIVGLLLAGQAYSQDVGFSQFYNQPLLRNPALAGIFTCDARFVTSYRNQWQTVTTPYRTFAASGEIKFPAHLFNSYVTFTPALQLMRDVAGTSEFSTFQAMPALNTSILVGENSFLSVGVMGGLMQQKFDPTKLILNDQFVAGANGTFSVRPASNWIFDQTSVNYADFSIGTSYTNSPTDDIDYYVGAALFHVTQPSVGFFQEKQIVLNRRIAFNAGFTTALPDDLSELTAYGDYFGQYDSAYHNVGINTFQVGLLWKRQILPTKVEGKYLTLGLIYRLDDAIIPTAQLDLGGLVVSASYDFNISRLSAASRYQGGLELSLIFTSCFKNRHIDLSQVKCPVFGKMPVYQGRRMAGIRDFE